jgi:hypothetical protein
VEWFGLALLVLGALALILVFNRRRTTLVTPPESAKPDPSASGANLTERKAWGVTVWSRKKKETTAIEDPMAFLRHRGSHGVPRQNGTARRTHGRGA